MKEKKWFKKHLNEKQKFRRNAITDTHIGTTSMADFADLKATVWKYFYIIYETILGAYNSKHKVTGNKIFKIS